MSTELTNWAANAGKGLQSNYILLDNATSTVAGGTQTINYSGEHIMAVSGTLNGASVSLYVKPVGHAEFNIWEDADSGSIATISIEGGLEVALNQGDQVYAQLSSVGGSTSLDVTLNYNS